MNFPYVSLPGIPNDTKRPLMPITLTYRDRKTLPIFALLDSGADYSYARVEIASFLDINLSKIKSQRSYAANGTAFDAYPSEIEVEIGGYKLKITVQFSNQISRAFPVILGQENFFDLIRVTFERYKWNMDIKII